MKKLLLFTLAACLTFGVALAQNPDYKVFYGSPDGSVVSVGLDKDIDFGVWFELPASNIADSLVFMHCPLASNDSFIVSRDPANGTYLYPFFAVYPAVGWDDASFLAAEDNDGGLYTNASMFGFSDLGGPSNPKFHSGGVPVLIGYHRMHTANDALFIDETFAAFKEGVNSPNGTHLWGGPNDLDWIPVQTYASIYFSPNSAPVITTPGFTGTTDLTGCFTVLAVDADGNGQTVTLTGPDGFTATGIDEASGVFCPPAAGTYHFDATDGTDASGLDVVVELIQGLDIEGCVPAMPGADVVVGVTLNTTDFYCGGFELLIRWDPTALAFMNETWLPRVNGGSEYNNTILNPEGPGTAKFIWIADVNNGTHMEPAAPAFGFGPTTSFLNLNFHVASGLPWGMVIPVTFEYTGDFRDNSVSDSTGYNFVVPGHNDGCVEIFDFSALRGDPNLNCLYYEIADAVLVAQRLIQGLDAWEGDLGFPDEVCYPAGIHNNAFNGVQEAAADLNDNGFADVGDLVWFINIINDIAYPPKLDPISGTVGIALNNGAATISSGVEIGAVLAKVQGDITPIANGMDMLVEKTNGMTTVLLYSLAAERIPAGNSTLFTYTGEGSLVEVSAADIYGRLLDASARPFLPTSFAVQQNYPNPFNAKTLINFDLPVQSDVTISIYNIAGQLVETISGNYAAGRQQITWNASGISSGIYFAKVSTGDNTQTIKMTMLK